MLGSCLILANNERSQKLVVLKLAAAPHVGIVAVLSQAQAQLCFALWIALRFVLWIALAVIWSCEQQMTNLALMVCSRSSWSTLRCPKMVSKYSQTSPKSQILDQKHWWHAAGAPGRYSVVRLGSCCLFSRQCRLPPNCLLLLRHKPFFRSYSSLLIGD